MFSPVKAIAAGTVVFALGAAFLVAQPLDDTEGTVPGVETVGAMNPCTTPVVPVGGTIAWGGEEPGTETFTAGDQIHIRDFVYNSLWDADDDQLDGPQRFEADWDLSLDGGINRGTITLKDHAGVETWEGPWRGIGTGPGSWRGFITLIGQGIYEGLSADVFTTSGSTGSLDGSIHPTEMASCDFVAMQ